MTVGADAGRSVRWSEVLPPPGRPRPAAPGAAAGPDDHRYPHTVRSHPQRGDPGAKRCMRRHRPRSAACHLRSGRQTPFVASSPTGHRCGPSCSEVLVPPGRHDPSVPPGQWADPDDLGAPGEILRAMQLARARGETAIDRNGTRPVPACPCTGSGRAAAPDAGSIGRLRRRRQSRARDRGDRLAAPSPGRSSSSSTPLAECGRYIGLPLICSRTDLIAGRPVRRAGQRPDQLRCHLWPAPTARPARSRRPGSTMAPEPPIRTWPSSRVPRGKRSA